jgi:hypothetical protein
MPSSNRPLPTSSSVDFAEQLLRDQTQRLSTNSCDRLSPPSRSRNRENLLSILQLALTDIDDDEENQDCDGITIDTIDWGRSSHHRVPSFTDAITVDSIDWGRSSHHRKASIADFDEDDDEDDEFTTDTLDWGRSSHHTKDSHSEH